MAFINNIKIASRLWLGFGAVILIGIGIALFAASQMRSLAEQLDEMANNRMVKVAQFTDLKDNLNTIARSARNIVISSDPGFQEAEKKKIVEIRAANTAILGKLGQSIKLPKAAEHLKVINDTRGTYNAALDRAIAFGEKGEKAAAGELLAGEVRNLQNVLFTAVEDSRELQKHIASQLAKETSEAVATYSVLLAALGVLMLLMGSIIAWLITRAITVPLNKAVEVAGRVAAGDLTGKIDIKSHDETGQVLQALERMRNALIGVVSSVRAGSESVATASSEIAQGNNDLSQRTEEQASA